MAANAKITQARSDLRETYLFVYDQFATTPSEVADTFDGINLRYARELLAVLVQGGLVAVSENGEGEDVWQTVVNHDAEDRTAAVARIEAWLDENVTDAMKPAKGASNATRPLPRESADKAPHPCTCGCGELVPSKSFYRPGHDARHAGVVGREIAAEAAMPAYAKSWKDRAAKKLEALPSDRLRVKAERIAEKAIGKAEAKVQAKAERESRTAVEKDEPADRKAPTTEEGIVKVGKTEYVATRYPETGEVTYFKGDKTVQASKSAAKTFQVG